MFDYKSVFQKLPTVLVLRIVERFPNDENSLIESLN